MKRRTLLSSGSLATLLVGDALAQPGPIGGAAGLQSPMPGPAWGSGGFGPDTALNGPSLDLNFLNGSAIDPRITFARASAATYFDAAGTLQTAASNVPRIDYDPVTHAIRGLLIEEQRTNVLLNSATAGTQTITVTAQVYTLTFYGTGTVTLSGAFTGSLVGVGAFPVRSTLAFTPTAGTLTATVSGSVLNGQLEAGAFATSYTQTAGTAATRVADNATMPLAAWFTPAVGSAVSDVMLPQAANLLGFLVFDDGTGNNRIISRSFGASQTNGAEVVAGVATASASASGVYTPGAPFKAGIIMQSSGLTVTLNGAAPVFGSGAMPSGLTTLRIGQNTVAAGYTNGYIRRLRYWPRALSNFELITATT